MVNGQSLNVLRMILAEGSNERAFDTVYIEFKNWLKILHDKDTPTFSIDGDYLEPTALSKKVAVEKYELRRQFEELYFMCSYLRDIEELNGLCTLLDDSDTKFEYVHIPARFKRVFLSRLSALLDKYATDLPSLWQRDKASDKTGLDWWHLKGCFMRVARMWTSADPKCEMVYKLLNSQQREILHELVLSYENFWREHLRIAPSTVIQFYNGKVKPYQ